MFGVRKSTAHVDIKAINMRHQTKNICGIFFGIPQHQKSCLLYVTITRTIVSSQDILFGETFYSPLSYISHPYSEVIATRPAVLYMTHATLYHEQTGNIITFAPFGEGDLVGNENNTEEDESIFASIDELSTDDESDEGYISTNALEYFWYGSQIHP